MKVGDIVKIRDLSWSVDLIEDGTLQNSKSRIGNLVRIVAMNCQLPAIERSFDDKNLVLYSYSRRRCNDTIVFDLTLKIYIFISEKYIENVCSLCGQTLTY